MPETRGGYEVFDITRMANWLLLASARTGRMLGLSAARLTGMAAAILAQDHAPPEVAYQLAQLLGPWHGLVEVGQEVMDGWRLGHLEFSNPVCL